MVYIKSILFSLLLPLISYSEILGNNFTLDNQNQEKSINENIEINRNDFELLSKKKIDSLSAIEAYLMGLWYFGGSKDFQINIDKNLSMKYLLASFDKNYFLAAPHYIAAAFETSQNELAIRFLNELLRDSNIDNKTKGYSTQVAINYLTQNDSFEKVFIYIKYLADILDLDNAKVVLSLHYFQGIGTKKDLELANYYLNLGCDGKNLDKYSTSTCGMFKKNH